MAWFRRRHSTPDPASTDGAGVPDTQTGQVAVPTPSALAQTEHALVLLAGQSARLQTTVIRLEHRVDVLSGLLLERLDAPSADDLDAARLETAKVAAELSRLEINLAARLDAVRREMRALDGEDPDTAIDLRTLHPTDTGWQPAATRTSA